MVRSKVADPAPYDQPDRKISAFFSDFPKSSFDVETFFKPAQMSKILTLRAMMNKGLSVQLYY